LVAFEIGQSVLPAYSHRFSPRKFTLSQLFACLVLKSFLKTDYRGVTAMLDDCPNLAATIGLEHIPHFTTLQKAAQRLLKLPKIERLLQESVRIVIGHRKRVLLAAIDSTGLESRHCSSYFVRRRSRERNLWQTTTYTRFPKLGIVCDVATHLILAIDLSRGPSPDVAQFKNPMTKASQSIMIETIVADAGYDSESNHRYSREELGIRTIIPARHGRPTQKPASGRYRRLMQVRFNDKKYGQRWQVETLMSMIKRRQGSATSGRTHWSRRRDMMLMAITHNIMIARPQRAFLQSIPDTFNSQSKLSLRQART